MNQWTNELKFKWNERWSIDKWDIVNLELSQTETWNEYLLIIK